MRVARAPLLDRSGLDPTDGARQLVGQVAARALELPRCPVTPAVRQALLAHPAAEVEPGVHVDDLRAEEPVEPGTVAGVGHLDLDLSGAFPQHGRDGAAVSRELVS